MIINGVPKGAEDSVRKMAMVAIERFLRPSVNKTEIKKFQDDIDVICVANNLPKKFDVPKLPEPLV